MTLRLGRLCATWLLLSSGLSFAMSLQAKEPEAYEVMLKKALRTIKDEQQEKLRSTLTGLTEQVQGEVEPAKRMQAAILLAAHYWETNYRLSRYYLGIAEALKDPTIPDFNRYDSEIEHMKIRFRHAALLDDETKKEIEQQLIKNPEEPIRHSLVEMLLDTNQALEREDDFLTVYRKFYSGYPRAIRKDRFIKKAALIYLNKADADKYVKSLEMLLDQYPASDEATWALEELMKLAKDPKMDQYSFTYGLLKKVYRNSSHDKVQQERILGLLSTPLRKIPSAPPALLELTERVQVLCYLGLLDDAFKLAEYNSTKADTPAPLQKELLAWMAYVYSEKGEHTLALQTFDQAKEQTNANIMFKEAQAKSMMNSQKFAEASTAYLALLKRNNHYRYRWYYFWNLLASGDLKAATQYIVSSRDKAFNEIDFRKDAGLYWEGRTLLSSGKIAAALDLLKPLLGKEVPSYYTMSARAAITHAQAVQDKKKASLENPTDGSGSGAKAIFAAYHPKPLKEDAFERSDRIPFASYVHEISGAMDIDPYLILAIMRSESGFNSRALSQAGAQGLMQLMPYTAVRLSRLFDDADFKLDQLQTADTNITYGSLYLSLLLHYYGGHEIPAVAAYNAGPTIVNKWLKECQGCPNDAFVEFIPYGETRNYVKKVMSTFTAFRLQETQSPPDYMQKKLPVALPETDNIF